MTRESNRARFPEFAAIVDACGGHAKLVFAEDAHGSLGKRPVPGQRAMNPEYIAEPPREVTINGLRCVQIDGGRYADACRDFGHRPVKATT